MRRYPLAALLAGICQLALAEPAPLPALGASLERTSVSGISSGAFMAAQLATAYSARFSGVGVIAGGPYYCAGTYPAPSLLVNATTTCMKPAIKAVAPDGAIAWRYAQGFAQQGLIDPVSGVGQQTVYAFSGSSDQVVTTLVVDAVEQYYLAAGVPRSRISYDKNSHAGHAIITADAELACDATAAPYINNCGFAQAEVLLSWLYGGASKPAASAGSHGRLLAFDQHEFVDSPLAGMDSTGYVYVPADCQHGGCALHVALHGCMQGAAIIGDRFYRGAGYNRFADANRLIVLYPQAAVSQQRPLNRNGCWDFWGYSTTQNQPPYDPARPPFFAKGAPQMAAIVRMIDRLAAPVTTTP